jgi:hypothetical protein
MSWAVISFSVHVTRGDVLRLPVIVDVLQQLLARQFLAGLDDLGHMATAHAQ